MIENAIKLFNNFRIAVDPIFPPPEISKWNLNKSIYLPEKIIEKNKFELIFDEIVDGNFLNQLYKDESIIFIIENMTKTNLIN